MISFSVISITLIPMQKPKTAYAWFQLAKNQPVGLDIRDQIQNVAWPFHGHPLQYQQGPWPLKHHSLPWVHTKTRSQCLEVPKPGKWFHSWREDTFTRSYHPQICPRSCSVEKPAFEQTWYLPLGDYKFFLPVFPTTPGRSKETLQKKLTSITPKAVHYKDTYSIKYIFSPASDGL